MGRLEFHELHSYQNVGADLFARDWVCPVDLPGAFLMLRHTAAGS